MALLSLTRTVPPADEPVTVDEAMAHLRVDTVEEQAYIGALITAAREHLESITGRSFLLQTWALRLDAFTRAIRLPRPPLVTVTSVAYADQDGVAQTLAVDQYQVDLFTEPARLLPAPGVCWPTTRCGQLGAVTITYDAGAATAAEVPQPLKHAILFLVAHWFENREPVLVGTVQSTLPFTVSALMAPYRIMTEYA